MWRRRFPFWVNEAPHWLHWKGRSPEDTRKVKRIIIKRHINEWKTHTCTYTLESKDFLCSCTSLPNLIFDWTISGWKSVFLQGSACHKRFYGPEFVGWWSTPAAQSRLGGGNEGVTAECHSVSPCSPLHHRLLLLWSNKSLSDSACHLCNAPLPRSIWSENLIPPTPESLK